MATGYHGCAVDGGLLWGIQLVSMLGRQACGKSDVQTFRLEMSSFDTHPPQNLNDSQLDLAMTEYPPEADGITEMTFTLASCQITNMYRCIADSRRMCGNTGKGYAELTSQERADWIWNCESDFLERLHRNCSPANPFHWVSAT